VALADKIDQLVGFFAVGEKPTGSGDPFALRRAALGVIRIIRENGLRMGLSRIMGFASDNLDTNFRGKFIQQQLSERYPETLPAGDSLLGATPSRELQDAIVRETIDVWPEEREKLGLWKRQTLVGDLLDFLAERLRVQLRGEGARHDVVAAVFGATPDDDLNRLLSRADAVRGFVESEAGANLLAAHRRAVNILRIEEKRDGHAFDTGYEAHLLKLPEEAALAAALEEAGTRIRLDIEAEDFERAMEAMAGLRAPVDAFFEKVIVNDPAPELRRNRLRLLARLRAAMDAVADFSKIEA
jgi:glycyl-tRNA synthetase beta chain